MSKVVEKFYCFGCGNELVEAGLGFFECKNCEREYLPTFNREMNEQSLVLILEDNG